MKKTQGIMKNKKRYKNSTIPNMQRLLNKDEILKKKILRRFGL